MDDIKRYDDEIDEYGYRYRDYNPEGKKVDYSDVAPIIAERDAEISRLKELTREYCDGCEDMRRLRELLKKANCRLDCQDDLGGDCLCANCKLSSEIDAALEGGKK
jgi:hypothetical protein